MAKRSGERCEVCGLPTYWVDGSVWCLSDTCPSTKEVRDAHEFTQSVGMAFRIVLGILVVLIKFAVLYAVWKVLFE